MGPATGADHVACLDLYHLLAAPRAPLVHPPGRARALYKFSDPLKLDRPGGRRVASFKLNISDARGRSVSREVKDPEAGSLIGLNVGGTADASVAGLQGKLTVTGGSDRSGVPMRGDVHGAARKKVLLSRGVGLKKAELGQRVRKLVRGGSVSEEIYQINCRLDGELPEKPAEEAAKKAE